jgi:hypothetical protein
VDFVHNEELANGTFCILLHVKLNVFSIWLREAMLVGLSLSNSKPDQSQGGLALKIDSDTLDHP